MRHLYRVWDIVTGRHAQVHHWSDAGSGREFRLMVLLATIFTLNMFDLAFTHTQLPRGNFNEANYVAATAVAFGAAPAAAYKMVLLGTGLLLLYRCRHSWTAEAGSWALFGVHVGLMAWWVEYLDVLEVCLGDPAVTVVGML